MRSEDIKNIAKELNIKTGKMKKVDLVRAIQEKEGNAPCFGTGKATCCGQDICLWRDDCA